MHVETSQPSALRLRALRARQTLTGARIQDTHAISHDVVDYFIAQVSKSWQCDLDQESMYNLSARKSLPYEKYVVLTLSSHAWVEMESQLGIRFLAEDEATYSLLGAVYKKHRLPASQFSAIWERADPTSRPYEFIRCAEYVRCQYSPNPILWQGEITLGFAFPPAFFENILAQDVLQQIKPL